MAVELPSSEAEVQALLESAVSSRASHIRREIHTITMANVRRLLESDLGLEKSALDVHKAFIRQLVDEVLLSSDNGEAQEEEEEEQKAVPEEVPKKTSGAKRLKKSSGKKAKEENGSADQTEEEDLQEEAVLVEAPKKKQQKKEKDLQEEDVHVEAPKKKKQKKEKDLHEEDVHVEAPKTKKQKKEEKETTHIKQEEDEADGGSHTEMSEEEEHEEAPKKKKQKVKKEKEEISCSKEVDEDGGGSHTEMSEEDSDISEARKPKKVSSKIASVKPVQNEKIEHLKKIIKACGLTISPSIYKRVKQQPDDEQDKFLIKELKDILSRRGLSSNPSDKEIKAVKEKIAMEKDLEGIDTTNIIMEPRGRRNTSQLFAPIYNPPPVEYDSEEEVDEESEDGADASEDDEKDFAAAEDAEDSD